MPVYTCPVVTSLLKDLIDHSKNFSNNRRRNERQKTYNHCSSSDFLLQMDRELTHHVQPNNQASVDRLKEHPQPKQLPQKKTRSKVYPNVTKKSSHENANQLKHSYSKSNGSTERSNRSHVRMLTQLTPLTSVENEAIEEENILVQDLRKKKNKFEIFMEIFGQPTENKPTLPLKATVPDFTTDFQGNRIRIKNIKMSQNRVSCKFRVFTETITQIEELDNTSNQSRLRLLKKSGVLPTELSPIQNIMVSQ